MAACYTTVKYHPLEFESPEVHQWLEDEGIVAVAVQGPPTHGVQLQVVVDGLPDILGEGDRSFAATFDLHPCRPAPVAPDNRVPSVSQRAFEKKV